MYQTMVVCPGCSRHVRHSEEACPFCAAELSDGDRGRVAPDRISPQQRLGRAAVFMFGAAVAVTACNSKGDDTTSTTSTNATGTNASGTTASGTTTSGMGGDNVGGMNALYGSPPTGAGGAGGDVSDIGGAAALYGAAPTGAGGAGGQ